MYRLHIIFHLLQRKPCYVWSYIREEFLETRHSLETLQSLKLRVSRIQNSQTLNKKKYKINKESFAAWTEDLLLLLATNIFKFWNDNAKYPNF